VCARARAHTHTHTHTKIIAYTDDLLILTKGKTQEEFENYAYIELSKIAKLA